MRGLYLSHGAPDVLLGAHPVRRFWRSLGEQLTPSVVVLVSAHHQHAQVQISADPLPGTAYDFSGFPQPLYGMRYVAPGAPAVAEGMASALSAGGSPLSVHLKRKRAFDHGAWVPLTDLFPNADVPVVQVSLLREQADSHELQAQRHLALGEALGRALPPGALLIGSGSLTHGLPDRSRSGVTPQWVDAFRGWTRERLAEGDLRGLLTYRHRAPHAERNHPTEEHLMPLFVLLGAFGAQGVEELHESIMYDVLAMDAYGWR